MLHKSTNAIGITQHNIGRVLLNCFRIATKAVSLVVICKGVKLATQVPYRHSASDYSQILFSNKN